MLPGRLPGEEDAGAVPDFDFIGTRAFIEKANLFKREK
jgi:hypothetical protein